MTPEEFAQQMKKIFENKDLEVAHAEADDLMIEVISSLGYKKGVEIFSSNEKWYA